MNCLVSPRYVCQCTKPGPCRQRLQPRILGEGPGPPGLFTIVLEALLCKFCSGVPFTTGGMCQEALDIERSHGEEGVEGKRRKDKDFDLWYKPGPLAEFRRIPMHCLSHRSRQQQHLLQWLQILSA